MLDKLLRDLKKHLKRHCDIMGKERRYRNAAVLIPLVELDGKVHILFHVRADHIRQGGEVAFPGGMAEPEDNGSYERTAVRETEEEMGLPTNKIEPIGYIGTYVAHSDVTIDVFVGVLKIKSLDELEPSEEVATVFTVPLDEMLAMTPDIHTINMRIKQEFTDESGDEPVPLDIEALGLPERYQHPYYNRKRKVYFYRYEDKTIWGMTGEMMYEFLELLK